jgi:CHAT domain-containing protein
VKFEPGRFARLPGTLVEGYAIQRLIPEAKLLRQGEATEAALKAVRGPEILHLATHGFFIEDQAFPLGETGRDLMVTGAPALGGRLLENPLLRSGLVLAGANRLTSGGEDGIVTALEASGLDLSGTDLVVLSACETGFGAVRTGEGVYGLRRAFVMAGARTLIMSLWKVDDTATAELMSTFHRRLTEGQGKAEALRQAQLEIRRVHTWRHPFFWASFVSQGDWRPLTTKTAER